MRNFAAVFHVSTSITCGAVGCYIAPEIEGIIACWRVACAMLASSTALDRPTVWREKAVRLP